MLLSEPYWDHHIPLPKLGPLHSRLVTAFVALICFINSYDGDFVFDDSEAIINNKDLNPDSPLSNIWKNDFWGSNLSSNSSHKSYRPLTVLTFRINYLLAGGLYPVGFHMLNITLHCLISVFMVDVFAILFGGPAQCGRGVILNLSPKASFLAALFFAAHPVHTESVAGIVGRADLLCALFFQLSFLVYCKSFQGGDKKLSVLCIIGSILLCAVAMLCKEQGITVLGVNAAYDILFVCNLNIYELGQRLLSRRKSADIGELVRNGLLMRLAILFLVGSFLLYARWRIMGTGPPSFTEVDNPASFAENILLRIVNYNYYYSLNAWLLLCPWWLCFDWSMGCVPLIKSASDWRIIWPLVLWCCLIGLVSQALCSQDSNTRRTLTFGLVLLIIPFVPASNLFFRVGFVIAERVLYLSSAGYCLILAYAVGYCSLHWRKHKRLLRAAMLMLLCVNVARSAQRSQQWRSEESLFTSALSVCPLNAKVHYNVGKNLADRGNQSAAVKYYREAVRFHPKYVHAMNNLGNILKERNELQEAEGLLSAAVYIQPDFAAAWMNLGIVQNSLKKFEAAERSYWNAIKFRKKYPDCYYNLGRLYADLNRSVDALNAWKNATMLKPDHSLAWNNMVILLDNTGNLAQAELTGKEALKILPKDHTILFSLANVLGKQEKYKESEGFFLNALKINSNVASCHGNLAVLYHRWGKLQLAKKHYELSLRLDPNAPGTKENYNMLKRKLEQQHKTV
ncbi:protein O-mannosyl-transferase TMTC4-like isoform X1 [Xyrauchen texanus]|uniref:protein O-mannosyl-transferase TMTC4-like isoform X1 n=1 Tax=Xyrauchen texanus TaxID=154827 RepID=UPI0022421B22|nr:protein O-mannosyl-transferase TMTC4-like isoform X1 [Xyrauchen texanus]XP_051998284.1 protein O-mannosyl-transferase TMTC4-like isoform X1 [Xyrauchen texanus]XP_051998285.1 protein O-mannosyl-transferase TMTC4-like isoform X1 [Xyrauchen texanus]